jgi:hypothetical protein
LDAAGRIIGAAEADAAAYPLDGPPCSRERERIRWFPLPGDVTYSGRGRRPSVGVHRLFIARGRPA